jgi:putative transposase
MARPLRLEHPGAVWHVTSRGNNQQDIYIDEDDRIMFLSILAEAVRRFRWILDAYVLMTNHFHLVFETPQPTLSKGMQWMNGKYAQWFNRKHKRSGHLFQGRFKGYLVEKESYLLTVMRYVVLNPVRTHMVARPEDYQWSSYRATAGYDAVPVWLALNHSLLSFGPDLTTQQRHYRQFVDEGANIVRSPFEDAVAQLFLGTAPWIEKMQALIDAKPRSSEHPAEQRYAGRPSVDQIINVVAEVFVESPREIRQRHGGVERRLVAWLACYEGMRRLGGIAAALRLRSTTRVSKLIAECDRQLDHDATLRGTVDRCTDLLRRGLPPVNVLHQQSYPSVSFGH